MQILPSTDGFVLPAGLLLLLTLLILRLRQRRVDKRGTQRDALDTVADWPPKVTRVLTVDERQAYEVLRRAMPGFLVLAQVPLARFLRVPTRHSYADWLQRVGSLSADLLLCDPGSRVLAVIDIRASQESSRAQRRHERLARVLEAAGIRVHTWREGALPGVSEVRHALAPLAGQPLEGLRPNVSRPMPLAPAARTAPASQRAGLAEVLAPGDHPALPVLSDVAEPVPSAFFEDLDALPAQR